MAFLFILRSPFAIIANTKSNQFNEEIIQFPVSVILFFWGILIKLYGNIQQIIF